MKKSALITCFLIVSLAMVTVVAANSNGEQLRRAMADISLLIGQLSQREADTAGMRDLLSRQLQEIAAEVNKEIQARGITKKKEALCQPRLYYNLLLMAEIQAYIARCQQKIRYYRVACDRLDYLYQQADDDLKIVGTLSGVKVDALLLQAKQLSDDYLAEAPTILLEPNLMVIEPPEKIWEQFEMGH